MRQCPPFILTFSSPDIFNTELVDSNSYAHYVVRTPSTAHSGIRSSPIRLPSSPNTAKIRPTLQRWGFARNPTIVVRPKSSSSEAKIVASLQWHHWSDSIFSTRWQVVRLEKILPLKDEEDRPFIPNACVTLSHLGPANCAHFYTFSWQITRIPYNQRSMALASNFRRRLPGMCGTFAPFHTIT